MTWSRACTNRGYGPPTSSTTTTATAGRTGSSRPAAAARTPAAGRTGQDGHGVDARSRVDGRPGRLVQSVRPARRGRGRRRASHPPGPPGAGIVRRPGQDARAGRAHAKRVRPLGPRHGRLGPTPMAMPAGAGPLAGRPPNSGPDHARRAAGRPAADEARTALDGHATHLEGFAQAQPDRRADPRLCGHDDRSRCRLPPTAPAMPHAHSTEKVVSALPRGGLRRPDRPRLRVLEEPLRARRGRGGRRPSAGGDPPHRALPRHQRQPHWPDPRRADSFLHAGFGSRPGRLLRRAARRARRTGGDWPGRAPWPRIPGRRRGVRAGAHHVHPPNRR